MATIDIGRATVTDGEAEWVEVEVAVDANLSAVTLHLRVINGERDGPVFWLQGGVHGNEPVGSLAVRDYALSLDPTDISGTVVALPVANPSAFANKQRGSQIRHIGTDDVNSVFPGDDSGSFSQRLAAKLFSLVRSHADYVVNAHSADGETVMHTGFAYVPMTGEESGDVDEETSDLGRATLVPHLVELDVSEIPGFMTSELVKEGIPAVIVESGGGAQVFDWAYETYQRSFESVARHVGVRAGDPEPGFDSTVYSDLGFLFASTGGFVETFVEGGDSITEDNVLAKITDIRGETRETFEAPFDGVALAFRTFPTARPGDLVVEIAPDPSSEGFSNRPG